MNKWTNKLPKEKGYYWFYGVGWGIEKPTLVIFEVLPFISGDGLMYLLDGEVAYEDELVGYWQKLEEPELPK